MYIDSFKKEATNKDYSLCGFGNVLIASQAKGSAKSVTFPLGFDESAPDTNLAFKVVFSQGHDASNSTDYMTLNGIQVDANVNGYYTSDDGSGNPAFVVIGNPLVLSSATYSIYANGKSESDYLSNYETMALSTDSSNPTIINYDGYIIFRSNNGNNEIFINGICFNQTLEGSTVTTTVIVRKGDSVWINRIPNLGLYGRFYKYRNI